LRPGGGTASARRELYCGPPKSCANCRTIALDEVGTHRLADQAIKQTVEFLRHQFTEQRRSDSRARTGPGWRHGRPMFTYADGRPIQPEYLTHRFRALDSELSLPPIRLHDLRHGAATLGLASHTDLKVIQQMLGHSSIVTTADTYTSVLAVAGGGDGGRDMGHSRLAAPGSGRGAGGLDNHVGGGLGGAVGGLGQCEFPQLNSLQRKASRVSRRGSAETNRATRA
jgi:hypothetical protein